MEGGEVITLRPLEVSDIDHFMVWANTSKEDGIKYLESIKSHPWLRAICIADKPVGAISVEPNTGSDACRGKLGYVLATEYWGRGIVTEAVKMVSERIFKEWPHLERLEALVDVDNLRSQRVLEKAGFLKEGVLRKFYRIKGRLVDVAIFSLLSTDVKNP
uniref:N-acetyltransferase domain-containing protein n=1 Tax=Kalanchoe fedtschenkoi TaxID=63787 RepID=A0A7N0USR9_KALFE